MRVMAIVKGDKKWAGYYDNRRIRPGEVFEISDFKTKKEQKYPDAFSENWMEVVDGKKEQVSVQNPNPSGNKPNPPEAPKTLSEVAAKKAQASEQPTGSRSVI